MRVMVRNSRLPDSLRGDLDAEVAACRMGAERVAELFERYGRAARSRPASRRSWRAPPRRFRASC